MNIFSLFVNRPGMMMLVSILFLMLYAIFFSFFWFKGKRVRQLWPILALTCLWLCWGIWESYCQGMGYNIRVDLLLLVPLILVLTIGLIGYQIIVLLKSTRRTPKNSPCSETGKY